MLSPSLAVGEPVCKNPARRAVESSHELRPTPYVRTNTFQSLHKSIAADPHIQQKLLESSVGYK